MFEVRKSAARGHASHGWLDSYHSFSFADYYDAKHMHFGPLRVINEDRVNPGAGFGRHGHKDMEIISYVLDGALAHNDNMGNGSVIRPGDVQRMSAGTGVMHSEANPSQTELSHFLQIWIMPNALGVTPGYEEKHFPRAEKEGKLRLVASSDGRDGSVSMHQDACLYAGLFDGEQEASLALAPGRLAYVHVARGSVRVNGQQLDSGDAIKLDGETQVTLSSGKNAEVLVFDLPH
jgi:redox-sensitive bicupin YhaK (pirin superfamily)